MHVARNAVLCVPSALVRNGSTFLGLPEGQNMVSLSHGTTVNMAIIENMVSRWAAQEHGENPGVTHISPFRVNFDHWHQRCFQGVGGGV